MAVTKPYKFMGLGAMGGVVMGQLQTLACFCSPSSSVSVQWLSLVAFLDGICFVVFTRSCPRVVFCGLLHSL